MSPNTSSIEILPKINRLITKKKPSHMASPERNKQLKMLDMKLDNNNIMGTVNSFIRSPLEMMNYSNLINNSDEFQPLEIDSKNLPSSRMTAIEQKFSNLVKPLEGLSLLAQELKSESVPARRKYPSYLEEDRDFSFVAK